MADVFISYKREERDQARLLADALVAEGFSVWWDNEILPGEQYRAVTLEILQSCSAALVIWSQKSVSSNWVLDEAQRALDRGVLIPVMFEHLSHYPLGFGQVHAHDLVGWQGDAKAAPFQPVIAAVRRLVGAPGEKDAPVRAEASPKRTPATPRKRKKPTATEAASPANETPASQPTSAPLGLAAMQPAPVQKPPFNRRELGFIAAVALIAPFLAWPIANQAIGAERMFYDTDFAGLFSFDTLQNVFIMVPLLTGLAWLYDRGAQTWAARGQWPNAPHIVAPILVGLFFLVSLGMREHDGRETHFSLWLGATLAAAIYARPAAAWLR